MLTATNAIVIKHCLSDFKHGDTTISLCRIKPLHKFYVEKPPHCCNKSTNVSADYYVLIAEKEYRPEKQVGAVSDKAKR